jgi:hypothetical protein
MPIHVRVCVDRGWFLLFASTANTDCDRLGVSRVSGAEMRSPIRCVSEDEMLFQLVESDFGVSVVVF